MVRIAKPTFWFLAGFSSSCLLAVALLSHLTASPTDMAADRPSPIPFEMDGEWTGNVVRTFPEPISCLLGHHVSQLRESNVFVGTGPSGQVYRCNLMVNADTSVHIGSNLGVWPEHGHAEVSNLAVNDIDGDGVPELLAQTSQITPISQPKLFIYTLGSHASLRTVVRPAIRSSWSHGLAFVDGNEAGGTRVFSTYCGLGEIVEFQFSHVPGKGIGGSDLTAWQQVYQLSGSGEQIVAGDIDNDQSVDLLVANGYRVGEAAIIVYGNQSAEGGQRAFEATSGSWREIHRLREDDQFSNVRFCLGSILPDGSRELFAWWCRGLEEGETVFVRYGIGPEGVRHREVLLTAGSDEIWPLEQMIVNGDVDGDEQPELYFGTRTGALWRFDVNRSAEPQRIGYFSDGITALTVAWTAMSGKSTQPHLLVGSGRNLVCLTQNGNVAKMLDHHVN